MCLHQVYQNGSLSKLEKWLTFTGHNFGQECLRLRHHFLSGVITFLVRRLSNDKSQGGVDVENNKVAGLNTPIKMGSKIFTPQ